MSKQTRYELTLTNTELDALEALLTRSIPKRFWTGPCPDEQLTLVGLACTISGIKSRTTVGGYWCQNCYLTSVEVPGEICRECQALLRPLKVVCPKCGGCGQVANTEQQEPWSAWDSLPLHSASAVLMGLVRPIPCPACQGKPRLTLRQRIIDILLGRVYEWRAEDPGNAVDLIIAEVIRFYEKETHAKPTALDDGGPHGPVSVGPDAA